jgi:hypothetical protein
VTLTEAVVGLVGTLGGAAIGAVATIYGPWRIHKGETEQKIEEEAALKQEKIEEEAALKREAKIRRLVAVRTTGRAWADALKTVVGDVHAGKTIDLAEFDKLIGPLRDETTRTVYEMYSDGFAYNEYRQALNHLHEASRAIRDDVLHAAGISSRSVILLDQARQARTEGNARLLEGIENIYSDSSLPPLNQKP